MRVWASPYVIIKYYIIIIIEVWPGSSGCFKHFKRPLNIILIILIWTLASYGYNAHSDSVESEHTTLLALLLKSNLP